MSVSPIVIKVGGALLDDTAAMTRLFLSVKDVQATRPVVVVHGGGPLVETLMASLGLQSTKIDGLRVTPDEHMPYICGALAGSANKQLCAAALASGLTPVGLSLLDGNMVVCEPLADQYGAVGVPSTADASFLKSVLAQSTLPVISSIGSSPQGRLLNVNADQATLVLMLDMIAPKENAPIPSGVLNGRGFLPSKFDSAPRTPPGMTRTHRVDWSYYRSNWKASSILDRLFRTFAVIGLLLARSLHQAFRLETPAGAILSWGDCSPEN